MKRFAQTFAMLCALTVTLALSVPDATAATFAGFGLREDGQNALVLLEAADPGTGVVFVVTMSEVIVVECVELVEKAPTATPLLPAPQTAYLSGRSLTDPGHEFLMKIEDTGAGSTFPDALGVADPTVVIPTADRCGAGNVVAQPLVAGGYVFVPR